MKKIILAILVLLAFGCKKHESPKRIKHSAYKVINVKVDTIAYTNLKNYLEFSAQPEGIVDITLTSQVSGEIIRIYKKMGEKVKKDEVIAEIDNSDIKIQLLQAKANLESTKENFNIAYKQYQANKNLFEKAKLISKAEYESSLSKYKSAEAAFNMASANLKKMENMYNHSRFLSPENGIINYIYVKKGEVISPGKPVCQIVDPKKLIIKTGVSQSDIEDIKIGQEVLIYKNGLKQPLKGKITAKGVKPIDRANYPIEMEIDNYELKILPGMIVKVKILKKIYKNVIAVSALNIKEEFNQKYVYIAQQNRAIKRFIQTGESVSGYFIVLKGLNVGDRLICEGLDNLEENSQIKILNGSK